MTAPSREVSHSPGRSAGEVAGQHDLHRLSAALVLPAAEKLSDRDGGRAYLRIVAQLINRPEAHVDPIAMNDTADSLAAIKRCWRALGRLQNRPRRAHALRGTLW